MRSSNPVFSRRGFSRDNGYAGFNAAPQAGAPAAGANPYAQGAAANPYATNPYAQPDAQYGAPQAPARTGAMTIDDVVTRTAITLGTVVLGAALAWALLPVDKDNLGKSYGIAIGAALVAFVLSLVQSFKRKPVPALIVSYAAFEGVFLGVISSAVSTYIGPGVVMQAVMGTMCVFAGVLLAYKMRWIRVTRRFYGFVMAAAVGFMLLMVVNLLFAVFGGGDGLGFRSGGLGILFGVIGIILGACFLALDFKQVEDGIAYGAPREESWLAAFGLTMTLVWIYLEMLRLFAILSGDD
ncbi:Bax inhibitor-1/YccA family protein [Streptomyces sp. NBC_00257]|uniref:Bax inhibitor-1/YccA family protein n=1 Tax=Streptomyces TaxID=1883 RepID=UPI000F5C1DD7|nr:MULTISPECIES: Bax inhibitor-1/YccA family protein [unclassified Streptomyces]WSG51238.1 Bax inhibitor-1/YccA family protein [Streptomyces sp. NBC_01732]WSW07443.1 Bax inhibitor-1/YccA family protein [Streptomyces sp. NBC_01005]WSX01906.1 Bax inhibitor-1/YccA family protein [Streptomyces sp. NBC_00987]WTB54745.1 Bax inhibitor-1/YccA family protein [Streptomyces sp. NBC_00826]WTC96952.1 Bax inhibitor-1/YccA family protein [Streptomyces sp. NBC_01650]WTH92369.1 Bax inhibitor-1/YccA family pro